MAVKLSGEPVLMLKLYDPGTCPWASVAVTPVSLADPVTCGNYETGPAVARPGRTGGLR